MGNVCLTGVHSLISKYYNSLRTLLAHNVALYETSIIFRNVFRFFYSVLGEKLRQVAILMSSSRFLFDLGHAAIVL